jgi:hypothetical protein
MLLQHARVDVDRIRVVRPQIMDRGERHLIVHRADQLRMRLKKLLLIVLLMRKME